MWQRRKLPAALEGGWHLETNNRRDGTTVPPWARGEGIRRLCSAHFPGGFPERAGGRANHDDEYGNGWNADPVVHPLPNYMGTLFPKLRESVSRPFRCLTSDRGGGIRIPIRNLVPGSVVDRTPFNRLSID